MLKLLFYLIHSVIFYNFVVLFWNIKILVIAVWKNIKIVVVDFDIVKFDIVEQFYKH